MNTSLRRLKIKQLDKTFNSRVNLKDINIPKKGWLWEIRNALGISHRQMASRLNVSAPAIANYEKNEAEGNIKMETLKIAAEALNCRLVYAIVPNTSLSKIIDEQTRKVAIKILNGISHSMKLEEQGLSKEENTEQLKDLMNDIRYNMKGKIWDHEV